MCPTQTEKRHLNVKAYWVSGDEIVEIFNLPETLENLPHLGDFNPDNPNHVGYLIVTDGEEVYVFTDDHAYQQWQQVNKKLLLVGKIIVLCCNCIHNFYVLLTNT